MNVFGVDENNHITGLITKIKTLYNEFLRLSAAEHKTGTSLIDFIKYSISSKTSTDGLTFSMKAATLAAKALNLALSMAVGALIGMAINGVVSAIADYSQRIDTAATKTKEEADAADNTTSSLKDLVDAYEELGDKSNWSTEDFDQAKDIQEELLALAKEQGTLDENKVNQLDLQNGKYEEQLGLLKDITAEQLQASESKLIQSKDAQGNKLVKTAKENNRSHFFSSVSANANLGIMNELKDAGIDVFNKNGSFGAKDLNDPKSIAKYYSELGKALDYIVQNTTEAQRAAGGAYHTVYQYLMDEQAALQDDVDSYNDSTDALNENINTRKKLQAIDFWSDGKSDGMDVSYSFDKVDSAVQTLKDTIDGFDSSKLNDLLWGTNEGLTNEQVQAITALRQALSDMGFSTDTDGANAFIQALVQLGVVAQSANGGIDALAAGAQKMEDISSKMDEIQSAYKASTTAVEEYNKYGYMSLDSLQSLLSMNSEYLNCLDLVDGKLQVNKQRYAELLAAQYAEAAATILSNAQLEVAKLTADDAADSTSDLKDMAEDEKKALENLLPALKNAASATAVYGAAQEYASAVEDARERGVDPAKLEEITNRTNTQLSLLYDNMNAALKGGQELTNQLNGFPTDKNTKKNKENAKSVTDVASAFDTLTKAMKEYNQYGYICADTMKSLIGVDDKFTACLTEQNGKLKINTATFRTFIKAQLEEANASKDGGKSAAEMQRILDWLNSSVDSETISFEQLTDAIKGYGSAMDEALEKTNTIKSAFSDLAEVGKNKIDNPFGLLDADSVEKQYQAIRDLADGSELFTNADYAGALNPTTGDIDHNSDAFKQMFLDRLDGMITACKETGGAAGEYLAKGFEDAKEKIAGDAISIEEYINGIGSTLSSINDRMDNFQSAFNDLSDIVNEYNAYGDLSQDNIQKLMDLDPKYTACLEMQGDQLVFNKNAFRDLYVAQLHVLADTYKGTDLGNRYAEILQKVADGTWNVTDHMQGMGSEAQKLQTIISDLKDLFTSFVDVFEKFNSNNSNDLKIWGDAMTEEIDKRIEALRDQNDEQERAIELAKLQVELEKAQTQKTVRVYTSNGYEWRTDESAIKESRDNLSDKQREWALNDEVKKLEDLKDKYTEIINLIGTSWEDYNKKLKYAAQIKGMTFDEMSGDLDDFKNKVVSNMKQINTATTLTDTLSNLSSLCDVLIKLNNIITMFETGSTVDGGVTGLINRVRKIFSGESKDESSGGFISKIKNGIGNLITNAGGTLKESVGDGLNGLGGKVTSWLGSLFGSSGLNGTFSKLAELGSTKIAGSGLVTSLASSAATTGTTVAGTVGSTLTGAISGIPVIGSLIALAVNNTAQQFGKISKQNTKIWSDENSSTGEKIIKSVGNVLYHLTPVEGWDKAMQYAQKTSEADGIWNKLKNGAKSLYYASGLGTVVDNIASTAKGILGLFGIKFKNKEGTSDDSTSSSSDGKQGLGSWLKNGLKDFWNGLTGHSAGLKSANQPHIANIDEDGPELLVRKPQSGRYTYLESGDGVVPADITSRLFEMGGNPDKWFNEQLKKNGGLTATIQTHGSGSSISIGDIYVQKPIGDVDGLARAINNELPNAILQQRSKR